MLNILKNTILSIYLFITSLLISIFLVINFIPLYSLSIKLFNLTSFTGLTAEYLLEDYKTTINYIQLPWIKELTLKHFPMSLKGRIHFMEVKNIFLNLEILLCYLFLIGIIIYILNKTKIISFTFKSLNYFFNLTILVTLIIIATFFTNFSFLFEKFHTLFFNNDYWIFDYKYDPIILALPEEFFALCSFTVIFLLIFFSFLCKLIYKSKL